MALRRSIHFRGFVFSPCVHCKALVFQSASRCFFCGTILEEQFEFVPSEPTAEEQQHLETLVFPLTDAKSAAYQAATPAANLAPEGVLPQAFGSKADHLLQPELEQNFFNTRPFKLLIFFLLGGITILTTYFQIRLPDPCEMSKESQALAKAIKNRDAKLIQKLSIANPGISIACRPK